MYGGLGIRMVVEPLTARGAGGVLGGILALSGIAQTVGALIFVHELGHFATAKWFGIKVTEFGFGFPPRIFGVTRGETTYTLNWIPLGGFVRMVGEEDPTDPRSFARQSVLKRAIVLCEIWSRVWGIGEEAP